MGEKVQNQCLEKIDIISHTYSFLFSPFDNSEIDKEADSIAF